MVINKTFLAIFLLLTFFGCKKENMVTGIEKVCCFTYEVEGSFNGQNWARNNWIYGAVAIDSNYPIKDTSANYKCLDSLVDFSVGLHTKELFIRESLHIGRVPKIAKKYDVALTAEYREPCNFSRDSIVTNFYTSEGDGHIIVDSYKKLDKNYPNSFEVHSYNPLNNEFNCSFDFAFIKSTKNDLSYPDTLYLKGNFKIRGKLKQ